MQKKQKYIKVKWQVGKLVPNESKSGAGFHPNLTDNGYIKMTMADRKTWANKTKHICLAQYMQFHCK